MTPVKFICLIFLISAWSQVTGCIPAHLTPKPLDSVSQKANAQNLETMVASPKDLVMPETMPPADGEAAAAALKRYRDDERKELSDDVSVTDREGS